MAIIQFKRGLAANVNAAILQEGEPAFSTDQKYLYVGTAAGKAIFVSLNADGKLDPSVIPHQAITDTFVVASQAAMLALSDAHTGDVAIRTDTNENYILQTAPSSTLANWVKLATQQAPVIDVKVDGVSVLSGGVANIVLSGLLPKVAGSSEFFNETDGGGLVWTNSDGREEAGICLNGNIPQMYIHRYSGSTLTSRVLFEIHEDGAYISTALTGEAWVKLATVNDLSTAVSIIDGGTI
jgi:hypothetical protein